MFGGGSPFGGGHPPPRAGGGGWGQQPGLPFAGIPPEMMEAVQKLFADEPEPVDNEIEFSHVFEKPKKRMTIFRFLAPHWPAITFALVLIALDTVAMQIGPLLTQIGIDRGIARGNMNVLLTVGAVYLLSVVIHSLLNWARLAFTGRFGQRLMFALRLRIFGHIQRLSMDYFTGEMSGRVMTRMTSDIEALQILFTQGILQLIQQAATLVFVMVILFSMNASLALVVIVGIVPLLAILTGWFSFASDKAYMTVRDKIADVLADLAENLAGIRVVAAYNRQQHNRVKHRNVVGDHMEANVKATRIAAVYSNGSEFLGIAGQALILAVGGAMALNGQLTVGQLLAFVLYLTSFFAPIQQLVQLYNTYQQGRAAMIKIAELVEMAPSVPEKENASTLPPIHGEITLENVTFGYKPDEPVLRDVNVKIEAGETFALVGSTGAGKSTIAKLITRFYDPVAGRVLVDGHDIRDVTFDSLRQQLGIVPQEPFLFAGSIRENIAFAKPDATDEELMEACRAVGISDLIERLPMGLDTPCHERGVTLSSGERQLIALARAFIAQPRVLILDEAMSNLDLGTESKVERALDILLEGRTAVLIAHRLNTAMRANRIAVVEGGKILEMGSHADLVAQGGRYAEMYATWIAHMDDQHVVQHVGLGGGAD